MKRSFLGVAKKTLNIKFLAGFAVLLMLLVPVSAAADAVVQSYAAKGTLNPGRIVALEAKSTVVTAPAGDSTKIFGVIVDQAIAPVVVTTKTGTVYVATAGTYPVLVSDEKGPIKVGDYISLSSTDGIGAEATADETDVLGQATTAFDGKTNVITKSDGVHIGQVSVTIGIGTNPLHVKEGGVGDTLEKIATALNGGHSVSSAKIYSALVVFLLAFTGAISLVWSGVRNGMISIGRNPLSKKSILASLTQVVALAVIIFGIGMLAVYFILRS